MSASARPPRSKGAFQKFGFPYKLKKQHATTYRENASDVLINSPLNLTLVGLHLDWTMNIDMEAMNSITRGM